jgi:hypothetical protein
MSLIYDVGFRKYTVYNVRGFPTFCQILQFVILNVNVLGCFFGKFQYGGIGTNLDFCL